MTTKIETQQTETSLALPLERWMLLVLPGFLMLAFAVLPFLPRDVAGTTTAQLVVVVLLVLAGIDFLTLRVPNLIIYPAIVFILAATAVVDASRLDEALLGGGALLGVMFVLAILGKGAMGMGDVKFACFAGCALGWQTGLMAIASGFALGGVVGVALLLLRLRGRKDSVPLTPFLAIGAVVWTVAAGTLLS